MPAAANCDLRRCFPAFAWQLPGPATGAGRLPYGGGCAAAGKSPGAWGMGEASQELWHTAAGAAPARALHPMRSTQLEESP